MGDGTGLDAERFAFEFTLFQYQSKQERQQFYHSTLFDQNLSILRSLCQIYPFNISKQKFTEKIVARVFN